MSEQPTATARPPSGAQKGKPPGKTYGGLTRNQWYIVGGVFVAALGYILWRNHQAKAAAQQGVTSQGSNECTDANGNPVDCGELTAEELAALQNQLDQLQSQGGGGAGGGGTGPIIPTVPPPTTPGPTPTPTPTPTPSPGPKPPPKAGPPPAPSGVHATKVTSSSITVTWSKVTGATSYRIRVTYQSQLVKQQVTTSTTATISGLGADHTYGIHVASTGPGGTGPEGDVDIKTSK